MLKKAYLEITNVCNLSCTFCPGTKRESRFLTQAEFDLLTDRLRGRVPYLYFHLMGEPLLHPLLGRFLQIAGDKGFRVMLTTNGTLLHERAETLLSAPALHKINLSLQSFEANPGGDIENYVNQCADFARRASEEGKLCELRLWNHGGLESLNERILEILRTHFPEPWESSPRSVKLRDRVWLAEDDRFDWPDLGAADRGERCFCYGLRDQIGVLCDGTVVPCCLDHNGEQPLGNLFLQSLEEIMSTEAAQAIYRGFSQRRAVSPLCRRCGYARRFT